MQYLLSPASRPTLARLAGARTLCAFDFDGTLSRLVDHPDQAGLRARTRDLLGALAERYPCVIISGRARKDVLAKLAGVTLASVIGNHGAETEAAARQSRGQITRWKAVINRELGLIPGLWVEDKGLSLAVHYRQATAKREVRRRILAIAGSLTQARVFGGKQVVNLTPCQAPNKGDALAAERHRLACDWVLYVGDDQNDEDAFALDGNLVAVRIGRSQRSRARYYLRTQAEIDKLLELLVALRPPSQPVV